MTSDRSISGAGLYKDDLASEFFVISVTTPLPFVVAKFTCV